MEQGKPLYGTILVIGAGGHTGRKVSQKLDPLGIPHKKVSRTSSVKFDWNDEGTRKDAISGTSALYLNYFPYLALPPANDRVCKVCSLAKELNVKHITFYRNEAMRSRNSVKVS